MQGERAPAQLSPAAPHGPPRPAATSPVNAPADRWQGGVELVLQDPRLQKLVLSCSAAPRAQAGEKPESLLGQRRGDPPAAAERDSRGGHSWKSPGQSGKAALDESQKKWVRQERQTGREKEGKKKGRKTKRKREDGSKRNGEGKSKREEKKKRKREKDEKEERGKNKLR